MKTRPIQEIRLKEGNTYKVELNDCCIEGGFVSKLEVVRRDEDNDIEFVRFSNGVELTNTLGVAMEEIKT